MMTMVMSCRDGILMSIALPDLSWGNHGRSARPPVAGRAVRRHRTRISLKERS